MAYLFEPPATTELPRTLAKPGKDDRFWRHIRRGKVGSSVLKAHDGTYTTVDYPSQDQIAASAVVYLGGHIYSVDATEAGELQAAGYDVRLAEIQSWNDLPDYFDSWDDVLANYNSWEGLVP